MRLSYVFESRNGLNMDYILIKGGIRDPLVDTSISCCLQDFHLSDDQSQIIGKTKYA